MKIVDVGSGPPLVIVPGIQGRWEWMQPGVDALAQRCRVDHVLAGRRADRAAAVSMPRAASTATSSRCGGDGSRPGVAAAIVCGVSYGGLVAAAFAARIRSASRRWSSSRRFRRRGRRTRASASTCGRRGCCRRSSAGVAAAVPGDRGGARSGRRTAYAGGAASRLERADAHVLAGAHGAAGAAAGRAAARPMSSTASRVPTLVVTGEDRARPRRAGPA